MSTPALWLVVLALWAGCLHPRGGWPAAAAGAALTVAAAWRGGTAGWRRLAVALLGVALAGSGLAGAREDLARRATLAGLARARAFVTVVGRPVTDARATPGGAWQLLDVGTVDGAAVRERLLLRWGSTARPDVGELVEVHGSLRPLGRAGFAAYARRQHAVAELRAVEHRVLRPAAWHWRVAASVRERAAVAYRAGLDPTLSALLLGLTVGVPPPPAVAAPFDAAGLTHLLVVSGRHAAVLVLLVLGAARRARLSFAAARAVALVSLAWLIVLVRPQPSILRAAAVVTLVLLAQVAGRLTVAMHALGVVTLLLLLLDPFLAGQTGFMLSVAAAAGVLSAARWCAARLRGPRPARVLLAAAVAAQAAVTPVLLWRMGEAPLLAVPANVIAVPLAGAAQGAGMTAGLVAQASPEVGARLSRLAGPPLAALRATAAVFARGPMVRVRPRLPARLHRLLPGALPDQVAALTVTTLDVGQGDAVLIEAPGPMRAVRMLVDAGPDPDRAADLLRRLGVERLDVAVLSHADLDHSGGMPSVVATTRPGTLVIGPHPPLAPGSAGAQTLRQARASDVRVVRVHAGRRFTLGSATVEVLGPPREGFPGAPANEHSLLLRVHGPGGRVLLTGDTEVLAQQWALRRPHLLRAEVLKVPHHGGDTNAEGFLEAVGARTAIVSVGADNTYGHPHPDVLAALHGMNVLRTDQDGTVRHTLNRHHKEPSHVRRVEPRDPGRAGRLPGVPAGAGPPVADPRGVARALRRPGGVHHHGAQHGGQHRHVSGRPLPPRSRRRRRQRSGRRHGRGPGRRGAGRHRR